MTKNSPQPAQHHCGSCRHYGGDEEYGPCLYEIPEDEESTADIVYPSFPACDFWVWEEEIDSEPPF